LGDVKRNRNNPIWVMPPKVAKKASNVLCHCTVAGIRMHISPM
jgi:hypothetical protein